MSINLKNRAPAAGDSYTRKATEPRGDRIVAGVSHTMLGLWSVMVLVPLAWTVMSSFKTTKEIFASPFSLPKVWQFQNYANAWSTAGIGNYFLNTVIVVGCALIIVMVLGAMCAYVLARYVFPGHRVVYYLMLAGLTFPIFLAIVPLFFILKNMGLLNTLPGLIIVYVAFALPFTVFFLFAFFKALPGEIGEAAQIDGAGEWRTFFQVMLPMAKPGLASVAIFNFLGLWNQYLIPVAINTETHNWVLSQGIVAFAGQQGYAVDFGQLFAGAVIVVVPVMIAYIVFQRQLQGSVSAGTMK
ncbi:carbohydrate ABC transporter permease [Arthrobacter cryoconiti]